MMAGWARNGILNSPGYLVRKENHGSDFAAYFAEATKAKKASSYAKASADKTADKTAVKKATADKTTDRWARMKRGDLEISPQRHGEHRGRGSKSQGF